MFSNQTSIGPSCIQGNRECALPHVRGGEWVWVRVIDSVCTVLKQTQAYGAFLPYWLHWLRILPCTRAADGPIPCTHKNVKHTPISGGANPITNAASDTTVCSTRR